MISRTPPTVVKAIGATPVRMEAPARAGGPSPAIAGAGAGCSKNSRKTAISSSGDQGKEPRETSASYPDTPDARCLAPRTGSVEAAPSVGRKPRLLHGRIIALPGGLAASAARTGNHRLGAFDRSLVLDPLAHGRRLLQLARVRAVP